MADKIVADILVADATVSSFVDDRVSPLIKSQGITPPAITVTRSELLPTNFISGDAGLDINRVRVDSWSTSYKECRQIATAARTALIASGIQLQHEFDNYDAGVDPGLYNVTQEYLVFV